MSSCTPTTTQVVAVADLNSSNLDSYFVWKARPTSVYPSIKLIAVDAIAVREHPLPVAILVAIWVVAICKP